MHWQQPGVSVEMTLCTALSLSHPLSLLLWPLFSQCLCCRESSNLHSRALPASCAPLAPSFPVRMSLRPCSFGVCGFPRRRRSPAAPAPPTVRLRGTVCRCDVRRQCAARSPFLCRRAPCPCVLPLLLESRSLLRSPSSSSAATCPVGTRMRRALRSRHTDEWLGQWADHERTRRSHSETMRSQRAESEAPPSSAQRNAVLQTSVAAHVKDPSLLLLRRSRQI